MPIGLQFGQGRQKGRLSHLAGHARGYSAIQSTLYQHLSKPKNGPKAHSTTIELLRVAPSMTPNSKIYFPWNHRLTS